MYADILQQERMVVNRRKVEKTENTYFFGMIYT